MKTKRSLLNKKMTTMTWCNVRSWGNSRTIWTSGFFLVFVPIAAQLLTPLAGEHTLALPWQDRSLVIQVSLPFNWVIFYFAAVSFFVAQTLYHLCCPEMIRRFQSYEDYRRSHPGTVVLLMWVRQATERLDYHHLQQLTSGLCISLKATSTERSIVEDMIERIREAPNDLGARKELFQRIAAWIEERSNEPSCIADTHDTTRRAVSHLNSAAMIASVAFFSLGFVLFLIVVVENFVTVIRIATTT